MTHTQLEKNKLVNENKNLLPKRYSLSLRIQPQIQRYVYIIFQGQKQGEGAGVLESLPCSTIPFFFKG